MWLNKCQDFLCENQNTRKNVNWKMKNVTFMRVLFIVLRRVIFTGDHVWTLVKKVHSYDKADVHADNNNASMRFQSM